MILDMILREPDRQCRQERKGEGFALINYHNISGRLSGEFEYSARTAEQLHFVLIILDRSWHYFLGILVTKGKGCDTAN